MCALAMGGSQKRRLGAWLSALLIVATPTWAADRDVRLPNAAKARDVAGIEALLREGVDVNSTQPDGATALLWAAQWNDLPTAEILLRAGASVDLANTYGVTPISMAALNASVGMVEKLLSAGASPSTALPTGETVLMTAVRTGSLDLVELLLARGVDIHARETFRDQTALMWALAGDHLDMAQLLIERDADARTPSKGGFTPLMFAARQGNIDAAKLLLARGADVNETAPVSDDKLSLTSGLSVLHVAALRGHAEFALFLLDRGANPSADGPGYTPLHWASWISENYMTHDYPLAGGEWAAAGGIPSREGKLKLVQALIAKGANVNARAKRLPIFGHDIYTSSTGPILRGGGGGGGPFDGATPFFLAASVGDSEVMRLLLAARADPTLPTDSNSTPLMAAAGLARWDDETRIPEASYLRAVELCVEIVCGDINAANAQGNTPLHAAAMAGLNSVVRLLAETGADLHAKSKPGFSGARGAQGLTPIQAAADNTGMFSSRPETAALLRELGAKQ